MGLKGCNFLINVLLFLVCIQSANSQGIEFIFYRLKYCDKVTKIDSGCQFLLTRVSNDSTYFGRFGKAVLPDTGHYKIEIYSEFFTFAFLL